MKAGPVKRRKRGVLGAFFCRHPGLHCYLLCQLMWLLAIYLLRGRRDWMNALAGRVITPLRRALGTLSCRTEVSVMEILYVAAAMAALVYVLWNLIAVLRAKGRRLDRLYSGLLGIACCLLALYVLFWFLWGIYFWTDNFQDRSGVHARPVAAEELKSVTAYFADRLTETADTVPRDAQGRFSESWRDIVARAPSVYRGAEELYPFLTFPDRGVKAMRFSRLMSRMDFTGFYCAYTGESNVNVDSPACLLPSTIAHELGHQRGFASEQECNFLAVLASTESGDPVYVYSGWLLGYIYLGNALYQADPDAYWAIRESLPEVVQADLAANNDYWAQFRRSVVKTVSNKVYDGLLKAYGEERGIQSYGTVVDMLVVYYGQEAGGVSPAA